MKVILTQDVKNLGKKNELVEVSPGYARNYLFKKEWAIRADSKNMNIVKDRELSEDSKKDKEFVDASILKSIIDGKEVMVEVLAGEKGKLFGSITSKDIADAIKVQFETEIDKRKIQLDEPIKSVGKTNVAIKIHSEVPIHIDVVVSEKM